MFTGLIETMGTVSANEAEGAGRRLWVLESQVAPEIQIGESVAVNGVCLSVVQAEGDKFAFEVGPETLAKTNLGELRPGDRVNLERSLTVGDRLNGHWVQGHVDGTGLIASQERHGEWQTVWIDAPASITVQMVPKGSIAVDGVSLTLVDVEKARFSVALIPLTLDKTTLGKKRPGDSVNLETDILGKYVMKCLEGMRRQF